MKLTERKKRFVVEYLKRGNATQAAIAAGFSRKTAGAAGSRLLKDVRIATAIATAKAPVLDAAKVTLEGHLKELDRLRDLAIQNGQMGPAVKAEECRGKVSGFYLDRHAGPDGGAIPVQVVVTRKLIKAP